MQIQKLRLALLFIFVLLGGCRSNIPDNSPTPFSHTSTATITITSTPSPKPTITEIPTITLPKEIHEWEPENVLIYYAFSDVKDLPPPIRFKFILYADGQIFIFREDYKSFIGETNNYTQILTKQLDNQEVCALLNTIYATGFFDYDESTYKFSENNQEGSVTEYIKVNSWQSKSVELYGLGNAIEDSAKFSVDESIVNTYKIINNYAIAGFKIYQPEKLAIWVVPLPDWHGKTYEWAIQSPSLAEIAQPEESELLYIYSNPGKSTILEGDAAKVIYNTFEQSVVDWGLPFSENGVNYLVLAVPLLPYQSAPPEGEFYAPIPSPEFSKPEFSMTCNASDGIIEIPNQ